MYAICGVLFGVSTTLQFYNGNTVAGIMNLICCIIWTILACAK